MNIMFEILKIIAFCCLPIVIPIVLIVLIFFFRVLYLHYFKGEIKEKSLSTYKPTSVWKRLFIEFPYRMAQDYYDRDPNDFGLYGIHCFCGEQGSGKTTAMVEYLIRLQKKYPKLKVRTNMNYLYQDDEINHWKDIVQNNNGIYGQVECIDEVQTWFNSMQSKNFPIEMLTEVTQQRKQKKAIFTTTQVFSRQSKVMREMCHFVYCPMTIAGCLTIVRVSKPKYWNDDKQVFTRYIKTYFFVHTDEIRNAFDTYKKIEKYSEEGFHINPQLHPNYQDIV